MRGRDDPSAIEDGAAAREDAVAVERHHGRPVASGRVMAANDANLSLRGKPLVLIFA